MLDLYEFWHSAAAVLALLWLRRQPVWQAQFGQRQSSLLIAGALLPLLDTFVAALLAPDSIGFLTRTRWLHGLPGGALALCGAALLMAFVTGFRRAGSSTLWLAAGWSWHLVLDALTPAGLWLGAPEDPAPVDWPAFPEGHWLLIVLFLLALAVTRARPDWERWTRLAVWPLLALYFAGGMLQYGVVSLRAARLAQPGQTVDVVPADAWRMRWRVVLSDGVEHHVGQLGAWGSVLTEPSPVPRGNDEARLLALLADPVVHRFYFRVFRNPVAQVDESPVQTTLTLREAGDLDSGQAGATFTFETDLDGRERVYRVTHFN